jgi:hypothetical protein
MVGAVLPPRNWICRGSPVERSPVPPEPYSELTVSRSSFAAANDGEAQNAKSDRFVIELMPSSCMGVRVFETVHLGGLESSETLATLADLSM